MDGNGIEYHENEEKPECITSPAFHNLTETISTELIAYVIATFIDSVLLHVAATTYEHDRRQKSIGSFVYWLDSKTRLYTDMGRAFHRITMRWMRTKRPRRGR